MRRTRHTKYITKVMFLCAQARPRYDHHRGAWWDGKIGIWPIGSYAPAQRSSHLRPAGTMVWQDESVTRDVYQRMLLTCVIPAIKEKWPRSAWNDRRHIIRIQQDGPPSHITPDDRLFNEGLSDLGVQNKILLYTQPANSPDVNINDLALFRCLQAAYEHFTPRNATDIIQYVTQVHAEYPKEKINRMWLTMMTCMNEIIECHGDNTYKIPHLKKDRLTRMNQLPITINNTSHGCSINSLRMTFPLKTSLL